MPSKRGVKAWLIRWEHIPGNPGNIALDGEVVAVLPARLSENHVEEVLLRLYVERTASLAELVAWRQPRNAPYQPMPMFHTHGVRTYGGLIIGHNPALVARYVEDLIAPDHDTLTWIERPPAHNPGLCEALRFPECELSTVVPESIAMTWSASK
jgi:hypothetical protein